MKKLLIVGADSFIAMSFIKKYSDCYELCCYSRKELDYCEYILSKDFFDIKESHFKWADVVLNFAAIVHRPGIRDIKLYTKVNTALPVNLAEKAKMNKISQFIQMSTISVYGSSKEVEINTIPHPQNMYSNTKLEADTKLLKLHDNNFFVTIIRPPMVYGAIGAPGNMQSLINYIKKGILLPFKAHENKRDFINIHNLIQYINLSIVNEIKGVILVSDQEAVSTEYLCNIILKQLDKKGNIISLPVWIKRLIGFIWPHKYEKLFGSLRVKSNFKYENMIKRYSVEDGIKTMININQKQAKL